MPSSSSHLRLQTQFEPISAETTRSHFITSPPQKKQKMSLTQTYYIAASARSKLGREASRADHDLRLLVGHANLLDSLMLELADAEQKQEEWFNNTVRKAAKAEEPRHIQWADSIAEEQEDDDFSDSGSESDFYDEDGDFDMLAAVPRKIATPPVFVTSEELEDDSDEEEVYDDEEDDADLALTRVPSASPPELVHDEDSEDDSSPPTTPPQPSLQFPNKEAMLTTSFYEKQLSPYIIQDSQAPLITSY